MSTKQKQTIHLYCVPKDITFDKLRVLDRCFNSTLSSQQVCKQITNIVNAYNKQNRFGVWSDQLDEVTQLLTSSDFLVIPMTF